MATDVAFPIHATKHDGRLVVLDGYHRLLKAILLGCAQVDVMDVSGGG
jgi:ParB-like chromosome segregation protein Spo0J